MKKKGTHGSTHRFAPLMKGNASNTGASMSSPQRNNTITPSKRHASKAPKGLGHGKGKAY